MPPTRPAEVPPHWRVNFEVTDCAATVDRCVALGGSVAMAPIFVGAGTFALLTDPQGAAFGVIELIPSLRNAA
jgi:predicted enzyme related to lactoylglutathione lyase